MITIYERAGVYDHSTGFMSAGRSFMITPREWKRFRRSVKKEVRSLLENKFSFNYITI